MTRGRGTSTANSSRNVVGSNTTSVVPSAHGWRSANTTRPSAPRRSRSSVTGGAQRVATHALEPVALAGRHHETGVQVEALPLRMTRARPRLGHVLRRVAEPPGAPPRHVTERDQALDRSRSQPGQHRCRLGECVRPIAVIAVAEVPPREQARHTRLDRRKNIRHGAAARVNEIPRASPVSQVAISLSEQHAHEGLAQIVVPGQQIPDLGGRLNTHWRTGTSGNTWSTRCAARSVIRRPPQLGQNPLPLQEKATRRSTPQDRVKLLLDEPRQALAVAQMGGLRPERLEVLAHDLLQDAPCGIAPHVFDRGPGHGADRGGWRAKGRSRSATSPRRRLRL